MRTATQTRGLTNGCNVHRRNPAREAGRGTKGFLSQPCSSFTMPAQKRSNRTAGTRTVARQKRATRFDSSIIARYPLPVRLAIYAVAVLTLSGLLPMALATLQIYLTDVYGLGAFAACMAVDAAAVYWLVRHA